jgi:hypothetical protein
MKKRKENATTFTLACIRKKQVEIALNSSCRKTKPELVTGHHKQ